MGQRVLNYTVAAQEDFLEISDIFLIASAVIFPYHRIIPDDVTHQYPRHIHNGGRHYGRSMPMTVFLSKILIKMAADDSLAWSRNIFTDFAMEGAFGASIICVWVEKTLRNFLVWLAHAADLHKPCNLPGKSRPLRGYRAVPSSGRVQCIWYFVAPFEFAYSRYCF